MKLEININSEIIDFCRLNGLDLTSFIQDCINKGYMENKWGRTPIKPKINEEEPKPKKNIKKPTKKTEQKKSEVITPPISKPIVDLYDEN
jgi:hypothetical protein